MAKPKITRNRQRLKGFTRARLRAAIHYNPKTGIFTWRRRSDVPIGVSNRDAGRKAGALHHQGYITIGIFGAHVSGHRLAYFYMTGKWPNSQIDHINCVRNDNRWKNIRAATQKQNSGNPKKHGDNTSGYKGVTFHKRIGKWMAQIGHLDKTIFLGYFMNKKTAHAAYVSAANTIYGKYARHD